ncbi:MAG: hypothetical protein VX460_15120 [Planctomycetota bacterium]|nr:hypothetical protein [Planctomycetota bacterium]
MRHLLPIAAAAVLSVVGLVGRGSLDARERADDGRRFRAPSEGRYHSAADIDRLLAGWAAADPEHVTLDRIGGGPGPGIPALVVGAPSPGAPGSTTVLLAGAPGGRSAVGSEAVLRAAHGLLERLDRLPPGVRLLVVPSAAPGVLDRVAAGSRPDGRFHEPLDEDGDGLIDEDGPDDLDGDGQVLDLLIRDANGPWCIAEDGRTLLRAGPHDAPRYRRRREGRDDDGDGAFNEDGVAGIDLARHFPVGWAGPGALEGSRPLSVSTARSLALWVAARRPNIALLFGGDHGGVHVHPANAPGGRDRAFAERTCADLARFTGRRDVHCAVGPPREGAMGDWLAQVLGTATVEIAPWGPGVLGRDGRPVGTADLEAALAASSSAPRQRMASIRSSPAMETAWGRWLDDVRGGVGFVDWHPVDLGGGITGLVGGWEARSRSNPPEGELDAALEGLDRFVEDLVVGLPRLDIGVIEAVREGRLVRVTVEVVNRGQHPTTVLGGEGVGAPGASDLELSIGAACDLTLIAGSPRVTIAGGLGANGTSRRVTWLLHVDEGATLEIEAEGPYGLRVTREIRP